MHFGRRADAAERAKERALVQCLEQYEDRVDHLYLLGDVYDGYIEYRHLVPKGLVRFKGLLARWSDRGIPITYLLGNHDPWHKDEFAAEIGVRIEPDDLQVSHYGHRLYLAHGDALAATQRRHKWLRTVLRHPIPVSLYRTLLPANLGLGLARWVSNALYNPDTEHETATLLEREAESLLQSNRFDAVVLGHSHVPTLQVNPYGTYVNPGKWYEDRTFVRFDPKGFHLLRWNGSRAEDIESNRL